MGSSLERQIPTRVYEKLKPREDGPFKLLSNMENVYKVDLPAEYEVSNSFNVADLFPYFNNNFDVNSWKSFFQLGGVCCRCIQVHLTEFTLYPSII